MISVELKYTYFLPKAIIPYRIPVPKTSPQPKILANPGYMMIGIIANLQIEQAKFNVMSTTKKTLQKCAIWSV